jgi:hypothetical protein
MTNAWDCFVPRNDVYCDNDHPIHVKIYTLKNNKKRDYKLFVISFY